MSILKLTKGHNSIIKEDGILVLVLCICLIMIYNCIVS